MQRGEVDVLANATGQEVEVTELSEDDNTYKMINISCI